MALSIDDLTAALQTIGLERGDSVIVHSSYRQLRPVEGGPEAVISMLLDVLGAEGNLMLPTFNYHLTDSQPYFDVEHTPGMTGIIPETGRKWAGAVRSLAPTHSVAVIGPDAEELTDGHLDSRTFGIGSPIDRLAKRNGKVLLLGVGHTSNSTVHIGEEYAGVPKAGWTRALPTYKVRMSDGRIVDHLHDTSPSCSAAFGAVELPLRQKNQIRDLRVGVSHWQLMHGRDVIDSVGEIVERKPDVLLCTDRACMPCNGARSTLREMGFLQS